MMSKINLGLLIDSFQVPYWIYLMIKKIQELDNVEITFIGINNTIPKKISFSNKIKNNKNYFLYKAYTKVENSIYTPEIDAFKMVDLKKICQNIDTRFIEPIQTKFSDKIKNDDIEYIKKKNLDVLVRLGFRILRGEILSCSKTGIWSLHHGDNTVYRGGPPGFWEVFEGQEVTGTTLQILTENLDDGKIITKSFSGTDPLIVKRNCNNYYLKSLSLIPRKLQELNELGIDEFLNRIKNDDLEFYYNRLYTKPMNAEFLKLGTYNISKWLKRKIQSSYSFEQWCLLFDIKNDISKSIWRYKKIIPPKDRFWADPHILTRGDNFYIFVEEFIYKNSKAHIAVIKIDKQGNYQYLGKVLEKNYHLSYPFVFEYENEYYMIPETEGNKNIEIYHCVNFPNKWEFFGKLMEDVSAVDTTIFKHNNKWWMFTGIKENEGASNSDELFLFYSDNPLKNNWKSHKKNPIISDIRIARPAGKIFTYNNRIYRPSQISSKYYGYGISINEIVKLNIDEYEESQITTILPKWNKKISRTHTFCYDDGLSIIDAKIKRRKV